VSLHEQVAYSKNELDVQKNIFVNTSQKVVLFSTALA